MARKKPPGPINGPEQLPFDWGRQARQRQLVWARIIDGRWHTLRELSRKIGEPEASISARLRDFRKPQYGGHVIDKRRVEDGGGTWEYRLS